MIELMETYNQPVQQAKPDTVRYGYTGITEFGLMVDDIDHWFEKIRAAGYRTKPTISGRAQISVVCSYSMTMTAA